MASWVPDERPGVEGNVFRGLLYALLAELVLVGLVYASVRFGVWNGAR